MLTAGDSTYRPPIWNGRWPASPNNWKTGQSLTQHLKRDVEGRRRQFLAIDPAGDRLDGQSFGVADGFLARLPVGPDAGQFQCLGNPAAVIFPVELNGKVHPFIARPSASAPEEGVNKPVCV